LLRQGDLSNPERLKKLLEKDLTGMRGDSILRQHLYSFRDREHPSHGSMWLLRRKAFIIDRRHQE
jgi:hypothetical protein